MKVDEAPPVAAYKPKFEGTDPDLHTMHIDARHGDRIDIRHSFKPKPKCIIVGRDKCTLQARKQVHAMLS